MRFSSTAMPRHDRAAAKECAARFQVFSDGREHGFRQVVPFEQMTEV
jgi:hypothetical protein